MDAQEGFSGRVLRRLFVLSYAPNGMWAYLLSTWFLARRDTDGNLDDEKLYGFLAISRASSTPTRSSVLA